jgi:hypothetical protein
MLGALAQGGIKEKELNFGAELGLLFFQMELSYSLSADGNSVLWVPNLAVPVPIAGNRGLVLDLFYRNYLQKGERNTFGGSLKIAFIKT